MFTGAKIFLAVSEITRENRMVSCCPQPVGSFHFSSTPAAANTGMYGTGTVPRSYARKTAGTRYTGAAVDMLNVQSHICRMKCSERVSHAGLKRARENVRVHADRNSTI